MTAARSALVAAWIDGYDDQFVRELLLVEAGLKPATLFAANPVMVAAGFPGDHHHYSLVRALREAGWSVLTFPANCLPQDPDAFHYLVLAPTMAPALRVVAAQRALEYELNAPADEQRWEVDLGSALGYPATGTEAYLGLRPQLELETLALAAHELAFAECIYAGDAAGRAEAIESLRRYATGFAAAFPELLVDDALPAVA